MPGRRWAPVPSAGVAALALLTFAALALPGAAESIADPEGDHEAGGLDAVAVAWTVGNATVAVEVRFVPGELPADRAVRGVLVLGTPGQPEPAEWYQFTIANATHAFAAHAGPKDATIVATSWTGDVARVELQRESPVASPACVFAVVEAGTMDATGFVRSDVAPPGFASPEEAWPVDACPDAELDAAAPDDDGESKDSPALPVLLLALAFVALARRLR